jgi:hypothetical protein
VSTGTNREKKLKKKRNDKKNATSYSCTIQENISNHKAYFQIKFPTS